MLEVERPAGVERPVVEAGEVRPVPGGEPREEREAGARHRREGASAAARDRVPHRRREAEQQQRRRDVRDQPVLEKMDEQQPVGGDRLERRVQRRRDQEQPGRKAGDPPRRRPLAPRGTGVQRSRDDGQYEIERLEGEARRAHAVASRRAGRSRNRRSTATSVPSVSSCSTIITTPESCWSVSAERP